MKISIKEKCKKTNSNKLISLIDNKGGKSEIIFKNPSQKKITVIKVDGCVTFPKNAQQYKCDFLVIDNNLMEHFVELKGSDILHAISQLENTIKTMSTSLKKKRYSFIIPTIINPEFSSKIQNAKIHFQKSLSSKLIVERNLYYHTLPSKI